MKQLTVFFAALFFMLPTKLQAQLQIDRVMKPKAGETPSAIFPETHEFVLKNGLKVFFIHSKRQQTTSLQLIIKDIHSFGTHSSAIAELTAMMLSKGTQQRSATEFAEAIDFLGASFSASAFEDGISIQGFTLSEFLPQFLPLFSEAILTPAFLPDEFEKKKKITRSILLSKQQEPTWLASALFQKLMFDTLPYGQILTPEIQDAINLESLKLFHQKIFVAKHSALGVVSNLPKEQVKVELERAFASWKKSTNMKPNARRPSKPLEQAIDKKTAAAPPEHRGVSLNFIHRPGSVQSHLLFGFKTFPFADTQKPGFSLVGAALGSGYTGRLPYIFRELRGWAYKTTAADIHYKDAGVYVISTDVREEATAEAIFEILKQLNRMKSEPMSEAELKLQKDFTLGRFLFSLENRATLLSRALEIDLYHLPKLYFEIFQAQIRELSTKEALELAKKYFDTENFIIVVVGDRRHLKEELKDIGMFQYFNTQLAPINISEQERARGKMAEP